MSNQMPENWADHEGWGDYYSSMYPAGDFADACQNTGTISLTDVERFSSELSNGKIEKIWFPGCGISLLPRVLAKLGYNVHATDIAFGAITFQTADDQQIDKLISKAVTVESATRGTLTAVVHDLRSAYDEGDFDLIVNVKSFQRFEGNDLGRVAQGHFASLKPGSQAIFDTLNVQGERRNELEDSLVEAGFIVPFHALNRWYRAELDKTGLPYVFVLGNPIVPWRGEYENNEKKRDADMEVLRAITTEFRERQATALEAENEKLRDPKAKIATLLYSTG